MNNWESIINHFRKLGGIADNIEISEGIYGRGLFPKNSNLPIQIVVPSDILLPSEWLVLDNDFHPRLSDECNWNSDKKNFYLDYLLEYALTQSMIEEIKNRQCELYSLPDSLKMMLKGFGFREIFFQKPNPQSCLEFFKSSRRILTKNKKLVLMPILEIINHDEKSNLKYSENKDISISGKFSGEILLNYSSIGDAFLMYETYGFTTTKSYAFSGALSVNLGSKIITIARHINLFDKIDDVCLPKVIVQGNQIHLSFLLLAKKGNTKSAKNIFLKLMGNIGMPSHIADDLFNGIVNMNRQFFNDLLKQLEPLEGSVVSELRKMAQNQLVALGIK